MDKSNVYNITLSDINMQVDSETIDFLRVLEEDEKEIKRYIDYVYKIAFKDIKSQINENGHYDASNNEQFHERLAIMQNCIAVLNRYEDAFHDVTIKEAPKEKKD